MSGAGASWEHFAHGADVGIRGTGSTREAAFEQAAVALTAVVTDPNTVRPAVPVAISCDAAPDDLLFLDWLNALIFEMATRRMVFGAFAVTIGAAGLQATARGEEVDRARHEPAVEIKGATFTALAVRREADGRWVAQCVVDV
jgi:SHS2 domain-containing protein